MPTIEDTLDIGGHGGSVDTFDPSNPTGSNDIFVPPDFDKLFKEFYGDVQDQNKALRDLDLEDIDPTDLNAILEQSGIDIGDIYSGEGGLSDYFRSASDAFTGETGFNADLDRINTAFQGQVDSYVGDLDDVRTDVAGRLGGIGEDYLGIASGAADPAFAAFQDAQFGLFDRDADTRRNRLATQLSRRGLSGTNALNEFDTVNADLNARRAALSGKLGLGNLSRKDAARASAADVFGRRAGIQAGLLGQGFGAQQAGAAFGQGIVGQQGVNTLTAADMFGKAGQFDINALLTKAGFAKDQYGNTVAATEFANKNQLTELEMGNASIQNIMEMLGIKIAKQTADQAGDGSGDDGATTETTTTTNPTTDEVAVTKPDGSGGTSTNYYPPGTEIDPDGNVISIPGQTTDPEISGEKLNQPSEDEEAGGYFDPESGQWIPYEYNSGDGSGDGGSGTGGNTGEGGYGYSYGGGYT